MDNGLSDISKITQRHLGFLVNEYGFQYDEKTNAFDNGYVRFHVEQWDKLEPSIEVWLKSEPKYTRIDLSWIIDDFIDHQAIDKFLFEDRLTYNAKIMKEHAQQLFYDLEMPLLKGIKKRFISALKMTPSITKNNYPTNIPSDMLKYLHYIQTKDPKWNPGNEL